VLYDFYTDEEKRADPSKCDTGLFYFRGKPRAPFAVVSAGGGFYYVGSLHGSFPHAIELSKKGYNVFALKYRVGQGETVSSRDLIAAVHFIRTHAEELGTVPDDYSLWGGSAGARISSNVSYGEGGIRRSELLHPAATIMSYTTFAGRPSFSANDPAGFMIAGTNDWIVPAEHMPARATKMQKAGIPVECIILPGVEHGFGTGKGMEAEGWMDKAVAFWEAQIRQVSAR
ncbi:MAG: alpha/beta hydrolase, partial [Oscillospiraceae bacterium]|nr:alpha/beta hydrolase [Oscillospiraceae bacterium]